MTNASVASRPSTIRDEVASPLRRRLSPLVVALSSLLAVGAPVAHHVVGARELRADCASIAARAAEELAHEAQERPRLWRYDSIKILGHLRSYRAQASVASMQVFDATGFSAGAPPTSSAVLWCARPVRVRGEQVGAVWVAMQLRSLRAASLALLAVFSTLAVALGWLVYALSMRTARTAAERIESLVDDLERSRASLAALNTGLEREVAERTHELDDAYAELRTTAARAVTLQETERRAIGRDLHDSVGQALTAIRIHAQLAAELATGSDESTVQREVLTKVCATTDAALEELRRALARLGPAVLDEVGLEAALHRALDAFSEQTGCSVRRTLQSPTGLEPAVEVALYRVLQESLTNVSRHAEATLVTVSLADEGESVRLVIEDDGKGVPKDALAASASRRGVHGMRERAELLRGTFSIGSSTKSASGTRVEVWLPKPSSA